MTPLHIVKAWRRLTLENLKENFISYIKCSIIYDSFWSSLTK